MLAGYIIRNNVRFDADSVVETTQRNIVFSHAEHVHSSVDSVGHRSGYCIRAYRETKMGIWNDQDQN